MSFLRSFDLSDLDAAVQALQIDSIDALLDLFNTPYSRRTWLSLTRRVIQDEVQPAVREKTMRDTVALSGAVATASDLFVGVAAGIGAAIAGPVSVVAVVGGIAAGSPIGVGGVIGWDNLHPDPQTPAQPTSTKTIEPPENFLLKFPRMVAEGSVFLLRTTTVIWM